MSPAERFARFVGPLLENGCREWQGSFYPNGYGAFKINGKTVGAHRAAILLTGVSLTRDQLVCHKCDNRPCVNVDHLFVGTHSENMIDATAKGRLPLITSPRPGKLSGRYTTEELEIIVSFAGSIRKAASLVGVDHASLQERLRKAGVNIRSRRRKSAGSKESAFN